MAGDRELTVEERMLVEAYQEFLLELRDAGETAADGMVVSSLEGLILGKGREVMRRTFERQLQASVDSLEKKRLRSAPAVKPPCATKVRRNERC